MSQELLEGHVNHLRTLEIDHRLIVCGPCEDGTAVLIILAENLQEAKKLIQRDPFVAQKYYRRSEITAFTAANGENNFLMDEVVLKK